MQLQLVYFICNSRQTMENFAKHVGWNITDFFLQKLGNLLFIDFTLNLATCQRVLKDSSRQLHVWKWKWAFNNKIFNKAY